MASSPTAFSDDDDADHSNEEADMTEDELCWRMDPEESLSDWTIELFSRQNTSTTKQSKTLVATYHVHRNILAIGSHRSDYFARLFRNKGQFAESADSTSRIELHPLAAAVFPKFLDFFYRKKIEFDKDSVVALHHLGGYFQVKKLRRDARAYLKKLLVVESCPTFYEHATAFNDKTTLEAIEAFLVCRLKECQQIPVKVIQGISDPRFWMLLIEKAFLLAPSEEQSRFASVVVSHIVAGDGKAKFNEDLFSKLTNKSFLPFVDGTVACQLLEVDQSVHGGVKQFEGSSSTTGDLSCLESRCVEAIARDWDISDAASMPSSSRLELLRPKLLAKVLSKVALKAQEELWDVVDQLVPRGPRKISVRGSGESSINGEYLLKGAYEKGRRFSKAGWWQGRYCKFDLYQYKLDYGWQWFISIVPDGKDPGSGSDIDFYCSSLLAESLHYPPRDGWETAAEGKDPPPEFLWWA